MGIKSCVKNYPFLLCFLLISFPVYIFLPDKLNLLIYSSPVIVFITIVYRFFLRRSLKNAKGEEERNNGDPRLVENEKKFEKELVDKSGRSSSQMEMTRRRNVKEMNKEDYMLVGNDLVDKSALDEEIPKEIREVKVDSVKGNVGESSQSLRSEMRDEMERGSSEDTDEEDEEGRSERNKAVEWTEDDEKNVMDLGLSEIERNKRLESLIARRRSRRFQSIQARKSSQIKVVTDPTTQIATILVPKNNPFLVNSSGGQTSPTPGSAPSILLPMRNPFDLPYDPQEEKPNLTGDSFQQEFMAAHQKDIMFCRHESFSIGSFDRPDNRRNALDRIHTKHEDFGSGSSPSGKTFKARRDSILKSPKIAAWKRIAQERKDNSRMNEFLFDSGPSIFGRITMRERRYHLDNETQHTPTNSLASDMQVEVSESSSPLVTVDGDEESSINDRDMEKKIKSGFDEMWGASSHLAEVDKNELSLREVHEVSELDLIRVGFSRIKHKSAPVSLHLSPVKEAEREPVDFFSLSRSKTELPEKLEACPSDNGDSEKAEIQDREGEKGNRQVVASAVLPQFGAGQISITSSSFKTPAAPHNTPVLARDSMDQPPNNRDFENVQELINPPEKYNKETNSTYSGNDSDNPTNTETKNLDGEDGMLNKQETEREQSKPFDETDSKSTDKPATENDNSKPFEDNKGESENLPKPEKIAENSTSGNKVKEQGIEEAESSAIRQSLNESIEHSISTNSVLSPTSVLNPKFSIDRSPLLSLGQDHVGEQRPHTDAVENNSLKEILGENLGPVAPQNELRWTADSTAQPSNGTDFEKLQEPINATILSREGANNIDESSKHEEKGEDKMKSNEGNSQILSSLEAAAELLKPLEHSDSTTVKETEAMLDKVSQDIASTAGSKPAEPSENSSTTLAKEEEPLSNPPQRSVEEEANKSSKTNESSLANNTDSKDLQSKEESGDRHRAQANLTRQWWLTID